MALSWDSGSPSRLPAPTGVWLPRPPIGPGQLGADQTGDVASGFVRFQSPEGVVAPVTVELDIGTTDVSTSGIQIDRVPVNGRTSRTVPAGRDPITMRIPVVLDGMTRRVSVEAAVAALDLMMGRGASGTPKPVDLIIDANGAVPYDVRWQPDMRWWIEAVEWGTDADRVQRRSDWHRVMQRGVVQVVQVVRGVKALRASSGAAARDRLRSDSAITATVRSGETLRDVAKRVYNDTARWEDIARLNNIGGPRVKAGRVVRLP